MTQLALVAPDRGEVVVREVTLPFTPPSKNVWDGWQPMWQSGTRKKWRKALIDAIDEQQFPRDAIQVECSAQLWFASANRRDWQNYMHPLWNMVADALVEAGVIADDTPGYFTVPRDAGIEFMVDRRQLVPAKEKRRTILTFRIES
jgi:hypothetical protein